MYTYIQPASESDQHRQGKPFVKRKQKWLLSQQNNRADNRPDMAQEGADMHDCRVSKQPYPSGETDCYYCIEDIPINF